MARKKKHEEHVNHERWLVSYADFITLLFATFTALYGISTSDLKKFQEMAKSMNQAFGGSGDAERLVPIISLDSDAKGSGDMIVQVIESPFTKPGKGDGEEAPAPQPTPAAEEPHADSFDPVGRMLAMANAGKTPAPEDPAAAETPAPSPTAVPEATPSPAVVIPVQTPPPADSLGSAEGKANEAMERQIKELLSTAGLEKKVDVRQERSGTVISLGEAAFFAAGGVDVLPQSMHTLDQIMNALRDKGFEVRVEGHTDNTPVAPGRPYRDNGELSSLRASRIMSFMIKEYGFPGDKLSSAGYGSFRPIDDNATAEGRGRNRRVDLLILNKQESAREPR